jgi:hypothetical protein
VTELLPPKAIKGPERQGLREAIRMAGLAPRKPTEADRPPVSTFPKTRAALEALRYSRP